MTVEEILKLEPKLKEVEDFVIYQNDIAKNKRIYWHEVWKICKEMNRYLIGFFAEEEKLRDYKIWRIWYKHLEQLATKMK